ncbi:hypothetical protein RCO27_16360 [Sphingosinicella sp. LHD-64]|uniref:hypothetical protein n=1 Tax=Sphingosinicella sp. LHD-64 TaxID=3072139 RepID=UPI00280E317D|nr:hypothetical protein [Sphingosinicella sp. LHD-64]MDQ8757801.1 hypothetical protein [Sphingosinicella sp. LHD-64]
MTRAAPWLVLAILAAPAAAQESASGVEQIGAGAAQPIGTPQISTGRRGVDVQQRIERETAPPPQLSSSDESGSATPQLTREAESARPASQLYRGGRTAQPSTPLSSPAEGRTSAVARVEGRDRCDPRAPRESVSPECRRVIETRAAEFAQPDPTRLSPEQRLLGEQRMMPASSAQAAAQRLATNVGNPNAIEDQSIASVVLSRAAPPPGRPEEPEPTESSAAIEAIVNAVVNPPQP